MINAIINTDNYLYIDNKNKNINCTLMNFNFTVYRNYVMDDYFTINFGSLFRLYVINKKLICFDILYISNLYKLYKYIITKIDEWKFYTK